MGIYMQTKGPQIIYVLKNILKEWGRTKMPTKHKVMQTHVKY